MEIGLNGEEGMRGGGGEIMQTLRSSQEMERKPTKEKGVLTARREWREGEGESVIHVNASDEGAEWRTCKARGGFGRGWDGRRGGASKSVPPDADSLPF